MFNYLIYCLQSGENALVLQQTITLVERAISLAPLNSHYIIEVYTLHFTQITTDSHVTNILIV